MVDMPAARRHHRSRIGYAFGLLALVGAVTTLVVVVRYPAESATRLAEPVPAPEITVVEQGSPPADAGDYGYPDESDHPGDLAAPGEHPYDAAPGSGADASADPHDGTGPQPGTGGGGSALTGTSTADAQQALSQSLFYSGLLGLTISLAGLGLVGTRRRMW